MSTRISIIFSYAIKIIHRNKHKTRNEIPKTWKWVRLGDLLQVISGVSYDKKDISALGYRILRGGNIQQTKILLEKNDVFLPEQYRDSKKEIRQGDILIVASTGSKTIIGKPGFVDHPIPNTMIGAFLRICRSYTVYTQDWLKCLFNSEFYRGHIRDLAGGTNINNIRESYITEFVVPLPPLEEQRRISDKINEIFALLDTIDSLQTQCGSNANILKDKLLAAALTGRLVEQRPGEGSAEELYCQIQEEKERLVKEGKIKKEKPLPEITEEEEPFEIPKTWKWVRLGEISVLNPKNELYYTAKVAFVPMSYISGGYLSQYKYDVKNWGDIKKDHSHFAIGDIGIAKITPCFQNRKSVIFEDLPNGYGAGSTELSIVRVINKDKILQKYLLWLFKTEYFIVNGIKSFTGTAGQQRIGKNYLSSCLIPLPPLEEQRRIVNKLEDIMPLISSLKETHR